PAAIGALAVYQSPKAREKAWRAIVEPWGPTSLFVLGSAILLLEGSICIAMALPIFLVCSSLGGLVMWSVLQVRRPGQGTMGVLLAVPLLIGFVERDLETPQLYERVDASVRIAAPPETVWRYINHAVEIRPEEMQGGLAYLIGVP